MTSDTVDTRRHAWDEHRPPSLTQVPQDFKTQVRISVWDSNSKHSDELVAFSYFVRPYLAPIFVPSFLRLSSDFRCAAFPAAATWSSFAAATFGGIGCGSATFTTACGASDARWS